MKIFSKILIALFLTFSIILSFGCTTNDQKSVESSQESKTVTKTEVIEEKIPFETKQENDSNLASCQTQVKQEGKEGVKELKYSVDYQNDKEIKRSLISETVIIEPTPKIISIGTKVTTPAPSTDKNNENDGYINVDGNHIPSPSSNPVGATAKCRDGTYSYSQHRSGTCSHHEGVAEWY